MDHPFEVGEIYKNRKTNTEGTTWRSLGGRVAKLLSDESHAYTLYRGRQGVGDADDFV